jgi:hypothetical protein
MSSIESGQVYRSLRPRDDGFRIRVTEVGVHSVRAVDASNGRPLLDRVLASSLHASAMTAAGKPRRTGYVLVQDGAR